jgi:hypothetical protein
MPSASRSVGPLPHLALSISSGRSATG